MCELRLKQTLYCVLLDIKVRYITKLCPDRGGHFSVVQITALKKFKKIKYGDRF